MQQNQLPDYNKYFHQLKLEIRRNIVQKCIAGS